MKLKVCGMRDSQNIAQVTALQPDFIGFVFYESSQRFVGDKLDEEQLQTLNGKIQKVGVFVNAEKEYILEQVKKYGLDLIQLHGDETVEFCFELKSYRLKVMKVFRIDTQFDFNIFGRLNLE